MKVAEKKRLDAIAARTSPQETWMETKFSEHEHSSYLMRLQAHRLHVRYGISWPLARLVAEIHYGRAAA